jgi:hypothetical protein
MGRSARFGSSTWSSSPHRSRVRCSTEPAAWPDRTDARGDTARLVNQRPCYRLQRTCRGVSLFPAPARSFGVGPTHGEGAELLQRILDTRSALRNVGVPRQQHVIERGAEAVTCALNRQESRGRDRSSTRIRGESRRIRMLTASRSVPRRAHFREDFPRRDLDEDTLAWVHDPTDQVYAWTIGRSVQSVAPCQRPSGRCRRCVQIGPATKRRCGWRWVRPTWPRSPARDCVRLSSCVTNSIILSSYIPR